MADHLDDFFAKRDKKRPKGKKFATADDATKLLETKARERKKQETLKSTYVMPLMESGEVAPPINEYRQTENEDDEWKEVVEVQPDFSNLKIQELVLEDEDDFGGKESEGREDADSDLKEGPWNKVKVKGEQKSEIQPQPSESEPEVPPPPTTTTADSTSVTSTTETIVATTPNDDENESSSSDKILSEEPKKTGGYVPPNRRRDAESANTTTSTTTTTPVVSSDAPKGAYVPPSRRGMQSSTTASTAAKPKKAMTVPNFENEESFPSLGS